MSIFKVGDRVRFLDSERFEAIPQCYPAPGTIGRVVDAITPMCIVQWPEGSTSGQGRWFCDVDALELVTDDIT